MSPDERDARLTAYALDDPGLTPAEREEIMQRVVTDPAARRAVEETRAVARLLTAGLATELAAQPVELATVPSMLAPKPQRTARTLAVTGGVAALLVAGLVVMLPSVQKVQEAANRNVTRNQMSNAAGQTAASEVERMYAAESVQALVVPDGSGRQQAQGMKPADKSPPAGDPASPAEPKPGLPLDGRKGEQQKDDLASASAATALLRPAPVPGGELAASGAPGMPPAGGPQAARGAVAPGSPPVAPPVQAGAVTPGASGGFGGQGGGQGGFSGGMGGFGGGQGGFGGGMGGIGGGGFQGGGSGTAPSQAAVDAVKSRVEALELEARLARASSQPVGKAPGDPGGQPGGMPPGDPGGQPGGMPPGGPGGSVAVRGLVDNVHPGNRFPALVENDFVAVAGQAALSTFGVDVDTASYAIVRNHLVNGQLPPPDAVRLEEIVNYFPYQDKGPDGDDPFAVTVEMAACPWQPNHRLARIGVKARTIAADKRPPSNLVFLVDVSGSMQPANRLPLVKASLKLLVGQLGENDRVAMVVYAGTTGLVLDSTSAVNKGRILEALDRLEAGGSTNGAGGLQQAYDVAAANFIKGGTNRVVLCTDGDWNVGTTSTEALVQLVEEKRKTGVFLSVFGFGMGNLRDEMMVKLAGKGNGNYGYIDTIKEAHKALVEQLGGTLVAVAKDVKIQVEFNPAAVKSYRLLGYEKRLLAAQDFHDDKKDAGEMGAGHVVTALYELVPAGEAAAPAPVDRLRYQPDPAAAPAPVVKAEKAHEAFVVKMRHKKPDGDTSTLRELPVSNVAKPYQQASDDFRFSAAAASFAMLLRNSPHKGTGSFAAAADLAGGATKFDPSGYRAEFAELVRKAQRLTGRP